MKLFHLIWVLGLAGIVAGCNSGPPVHGCDIQTNGTCDDGSNGGGGTGGGTGGTAGGGGGEGACTNAEDAATYMDLSYLDSRGNEEMGPGAASAIASDCVFGSDSSDPVNPGCGTEAGNVVACAILPTGCPPETIAALTNCVVSCTQTLIEDITGSTLSQDCADCYGESVACSANLCVAAGCTNPTSPGCIQCRCDEGCTPGFDVCSGLPPSGDCS
jgi:hypothetical protein